jgi:hypothetical protein
MEETGYPGGWQQYGKSDSHTDVRSLTFPFLWLAVLDGSTLSVYYVQMGGVLPFEQGAHHAL